MNCMKKEIDLSVYFALNYSYYGKIRNIYRSIIVFER